MFDKVILDIYNFNSFWIWGLNSDFHIKKIFIYVNKSAK